MTKKLRELKEKAAKAVGRHGIIERIKLSKKFCEEQNGTSGCKTCYTDFDEILDLLGGERDYSEEVHEGLIKHFIEPRSIRGVEKIEISSLRGEWVITHPISPGCGDDTVMSLQVLGKKINELIDIIAPSGELTN